MGRHLWRCSAVVLVVTVLIPAASGIAAVTGASAIPAKVVGVWSRNVTTAEWKKYGVVGEPAGVWEIRFFKNGNISVYRPSPTCSSCEADATPLASVTGASLKIGPIADCMTTEGFYGWYGWKITGRTLALKLLTDACGPRKALFTGTWKRQ